MARDAAEGQAVGGQASENGQCQPCRGWCQKTPASAATSTLQSSVLLLLTFDNSVVAMSVLLSSD
eukprot:23844-Eustigmatos_ZCMA.PRE.1